jgi:hypothetical protein
MSNDEEGVTRHVIRSPEFQDFATGNKNWETDDGSVVRGGQRPTSQQPEKKKQSHCELMRIKGWIISFS